MSSQSPYSELSRWWLQVALALGALGALGWATATWGIAGAETVGVEPAAADTVTVGFNCLTSNIPVLGQQASTRQQGVTTTAVSQGGRSRAATAMGVSSAEDSTARWTKLVA